MDRNEILALIEKGEGNRLEFKERFNDSVLKTIAAFANTYGGMIIISVTNKKEIVGIGINDADFQKIINQVVNKLGIVPNFEIVDVNDKSILVIEVQKSQIPITSDGVYYQRVGNISREMNFEELKRFSQKDLKWEILTSTKLMSTL